MRESPLTMRRTYLIIALALVILGAAVWAYLSLSAAPAPIIVASGTPSLPTAGTGTSATSAKETDSTAPPVPEAVSARLVKIASGPIVPGMSVHTTPGTASTSAQTVVSFIDRKSGNVYTYGIQSKALTRTSNRTIPGIQSADWLTDGSAAVVRYLSGADFSMINTYLLPANGGAGTFLSQNLAGVAVAPTGILTLASGVNGSVASFGKTDGSHASQVFTTPLTAVRVGFAGKGKYLAFTKPSASLPGAAFLIDSAGRFSRIAGPRMGLVALASPSGAWLLVSFTNGGSLVSELVNTATGESLPLPLGTIADKCAWTADSAAVYCGVPMDPSPSYAYPDDWYQGVVPFSDRIWKIQVAGRYAQLVLDFNKDAGATLDAEALALDASGTTLVFVNKNDGSLWAYSL